MTLIDGTAILLYFGNNYVIKIVPNVFIATVLTMYFLFKQINTKVTQIIKAAMVLCVGDDLKKHFRMQRFCELSDRLDEIAILHLELCDMLKVINAVASVQLTIHITLKFTNLYCCSLSSCTCT